jgi:hypothetical protein
MASGGLGSLSVDLLLQTADWVSGLTKAEHQAQKSADALEAKFNKMTDSVGSSLKGMVAGLAAAFAVDRIVGFINETQKAADELGKLATKTGASVQFLGEMSVAADLSGASVEQLGKGFNALNKTIAEAAGDSGSKAASIFKALNIEVRDASGALKSSEQIFKETAAALAELEDGPLKSAAAMALLGKSGAELLPTFEEMQKQTAEAKAAAEEYGAAMANLVQPATAFNDSLTLIGVKLKTVAAEIAGGFLTYFNKLDEQFGVTSLAAEGLGKVLTWLGNVVKIFVMLVDGMVSTLAAAGEILGGFVAALVLAAQGKMSAAWDALTESTDRAKERLRESGERMKELIAPTLEAAEATERKKKASDDLARALAGNNGASKIHIDLLKLETIALDKNIDALFKRGLELGKQVEKQMELDAKFLQYVKSIDAETAALFKSSREKERAAKQQELLNRATEAGWQNTKEYERQVIALNEALSNKWAAEDFIAGQKKIHD